MNVGGKGSGLFPVAEAIGIMFGISTDLIGSVGIPCVQGSEGAYHCDKSKGEKHEDENNFPRCPSACQLHECNMDGNIPTARTLSRHMREQQKG